ncbi:molybdopterin converting factor subunit 1 [Bacillus suaedae]|uniref:Molybdopterin synthase sulfur carrier subunit n=1 Tax=Halalkalibacter suaedae TaxID=2822140 RepID=A0A940WV56_9BACI|nr:molybdopterin converting factor subunit 1 [Bacillus suaedae]MBP3952985.1 molybdopterin converting factor subunit 1 [Bacillus suaedae]
MIKILLFAQLQEESGHEQIESDKKEISVADLIDWLHQHYTLPSLSNAMIAINETFATEQDIVKEGDTIAFIPPVSGG